MQCCQRVLLQVFAAMPVSIADVPPDTSADEIVRAAFANEALPIYAHRSSGHAVQPFALRQRLPAIASPRPTE